MNHSYYDHNANAYSRRTAARALSEPFREFCELLPPGAGVLDVGCGPGHHLARFQEMGFKAQGVDSSEEMVKLARLRTGAEVKCSDALLTSFSKESLDGIWASQLLSHFPPPSCQRAMAQFFLWLKKGGALFVSIEEGEGTREDRTDDLQGPARKIYLYTVDNVASLIRQAGFQMVQQGKDPSRNAVGYIAKRI